MRKAISLYFLAALALAAPAWAGEVEEDSTLPSTEARVPNYIGSVGLITAPSAYTIGDRTASGYISGNADFFGGGVVVGITDRFEIGIGVLDLDDDLGGDTEFLLNLKANLLQEKNNWPAFSVGVVDVADSLDADPGWYVMASKYFTRNQTDQKFALKGHLGFGGGFFDEEIIAGAELFFKPNVTVMAELVADEVNIGARLHWKAFTASLAWFDFDNLGGQLSYNVRF